ncbi:cytochrome p450-like-31 [Trichoderma arundinaceum]|uniref:Cytochrome p450-like-31 n=1 Tax=Trichoderma arundinaceum TaxID=490622 RepID=A0A395NIH2_TRIAR|nr:cytochrome p450-like-31 [Trichoderma arundinaceum]
MKNGAITSNRPRMNNFVGRRIYADILGSKQCQGIKKYQEYETKILLRDLSLTPDKFFTHMERTLSSVIFSAVYGVRISRLDHPIIVELFDLWASILQYVQPGKLLVDWIPVLERLPISWQPWARLADSYAARESAISMAFLRTLRKQIADGTEPTCFGVGILKHQKKEGFGDDVTIGLLNGIILAGADTTTTMMQSFFKVIAMNPEAQQRAQEELDQVVGPSRLPTWEDEPNLPYVRAVIKELHRYCSLLTIGVWHVASEEFTYQGCRIPNETLIMPNVGTLHRDPERYDDADKFMPERYLGDDLSAYNSSKQPDYLKRDHINYGFGRRLCQDGFVRKPKPFKLDITPRSEMARQVVMKTAVEATTDLPDIESIEMTE